MFANSKLASKILGLIQLLQIRRFIGAPVRKSPIHQFSWLIRKSQIRKSLQNTAHCLKTVLKSAYNFFIFVREKYVFDSLHKF